MSTQKDSLLFFLCAGSICTVLNRRAQIVSALFSFFSGRCSQFVLNFFKKFSNVLNFFCQLFSKIFRGFAAHTTKVYHFRPSTNAFALISINSSHNKHFYVTISYTFDQYSSSNRTQFLKFTCMPRTKSNVPSPRLRANTSTHLPQLFCS